jgi:hypothetical protein
MIDDQLNRLGCKIFFEADSAPKELARLLAEGATLEVSSGLTSSVIRSGIGELELRRNEDRHESSARQFPDGFSYFPYVLELYPCPVVRHEDEVHYVAQLLDRLWSSGFPAVASCDYEDELPHRGGYRDASLPWPSPTFEGSTNGAPSPGDPGIRGATQGPCWPERSSDPR